jgi:hypothetical protein
MMTRVARIIPKQFPAIFLQGQSLRIYNQMSFHLRKRLPFPAFQRLASQFRRGVRQYKLQSRIPYYPGYSRYVWIDGTGKKGMAVIFYKNLTIVSMSFKTLTAYPETDHTYTNTTFSLPFRGTWFTSMGGLNELVNYHYAYDYKRYAFDFVIVKNDLMVSGNRLKNESYFAFGQEILAPASGRVVKVENDVPDNNPVGKMNKARRAGNFVVIDHGNEEYSFLAHLKYKSVRVQVGDEVKQGDVIGLCGNSGYSQGPHLHFQVSTSPDYPNTSSIRIRFQDFPEPMQGQFVTGPYNTTTA